MDVTFRTAELGDVNAVLRMWIEADAEPSHTNNAEGLQRLISHDSSSLILAMAGTRIIGSVIAAWDGWRGSIYRLAVVPDRRRQRIGRRLLVEAEARLTREGALRLQAIVVEDDGKARGFWEATGWEQQTHRLRFLKG